MNKTKRMLSIFLVVLMLFTSLPMNVFAEEITSVSEENTTQEETTAVSEEESSEEEPDEEPDEEATEYKVGQEYTINGVVYKVGTYNKVEVVGEGEGMPEYVEILSYLGEFPVTSIGHSAFRDCMTVKKVILPETVTLISTYAFSDSGLAELEIKSEKANVRTDFKGTPLYENPDNWQNGVLIVSGYAVSSKAEGSVILGEDVVGIGGQCFGYNSLVTNLTILNRECHIFSSSGTLALYATIYGYKNSTAQKHAATYNYKFSELCECGGGVFKPATSSYCNGVVGYSEGYWCESCNAYSSGGYIKDATFDHTDLDSDGVCDFCKLTTDTVILDAGKGANERFWCITTDGLFIIGGEGEAKGFASSAEVHLKKGRIKELVFLDGITSIGSKAFRNTNTVEKITLPDTVTDIKSEAFYGCFKVKEIVLGKGLKTIGTKAFADSNFLEKVVLHEGVTTIDGAAFAGCRQLVEVTLPTTLETIGYRAFENCERLNDVVFYDSLKSIGRAAFYNCTRLTKIVIPESVEFVDQLAFSGCINLADIEMKAKYLEISANCFNSCPGYNNPENIKNGFRMLGTVAFYESEPIHTEIVLGDEITSLARGWLGSKTNIEEIYVLDRRCFVGDFGLVVEDIVVHGYKDSPAEDFAKKVKLFFAPICECENTEFHPETQSSCDGTVGFTAGEWCDYCKTWQTGHEVNTADMHSFSEDSELCLECGESKDSEILSAGVLTGGYWTLNSNKELVVYGKGTVSLPENMPDIKRWLKAIGEEAKSARIKGTVEKIGKKLFKNGTSLEKIEIENGVYAIESEAFYNCSSVKEMKLSVVLLEIGYSAFESMSALESVTVPSAVYKIGSAAFKNCTSLKEAVFESTPETMDMDIFNNCISLKNVSFNEEIYTIPSHMFYNCSALETVSLKNTYINSVRSGAFYGCKSLTEFTLPVKNYIEANAFEGCESLKEVTIVASSVSYAAFKNCKGLETVSIDGNTSMSNSVFENCISLKKINFPEGKKVNMEAQSFKGCASLESIVLPVTWTAVPQTFFYGCTSLKNIEIPESIKTIGAYAFYGCSSLEKITLGENITAVGSKAFYGADSLSEISFLNKETAIAEPVTTDDVYYRTIPEATVVKGYIGSTADAYATNYGNDFLAFDAKEIKEIFIETYPAKLNYVVDKDTEFDLNGISVKVIYEDDTSRIFKNGFTVDASEVDITKVGTYTVTVTFQGKEAFFDLFVALTDDPLEQEAVLLPEYGKLEFKHNAKTTVTVKFIPVETKTYYFVIKGANYANFYLPDGSHKIIGENRNGVGLKKEIDLTKDETYYIVVSCPAGKNITVEQTGVCELEELPDGTYKAVNCLSEKNNIFIPGEINGKKITVIGEKSIISTTVYNLTLGEGIEIIEANAFINNRQIKSLTLPDSLKIIGEKAFYDLTTLEKVIGGKNVEEYGASAFERCLELTEFTMSEKVRVIGNKAFSHCRLTALVFPETLEKVEYEAFHGCSGLSSIRFLGENVDFAGKAFSSCYALEEIVLPKDITEIPARMFSGCTGLKEFTVPETVEVIGASAFYSCKSLTEIVLPESIKAIGNSVFGYCEGLKTVKLNDNIESMGENVFCNCISLESIEFPAGITEFGIKTFYDCDALKEVTFLGEVTEIPEKMFYSCDNLEKVNSQGKITTVEKDAFIYCYSFSQNELLAELTYIGENAFCWTNLTEINLNENITYLGDSAFAATSAKNVVLPEAITKIPTGLFNNSLIESVTFMGDITEIGDSAFSYCKNLKEISIPTSVESIGKEAFAFTKGLETDIDLSGVREIGENAFQYSAITGVTFGDNLQSIADSAFSYSGIESVVIPENVTVGMGAFSACDKLIEVTVGKNSTVGYGGFRWSDNIERVFVEDGAILGSSSLDGCKNLKELHFKNTISPESNLGEINSEAVIYGLEESNAHRYADKFGFTFVAYEGSAHIHSYQSELLPETKCNVYRKTRYFCSCGKEYTEIAKDRTHVYGDFTVEKAPSCTEPGIKSKHCICGKTRAEITVIPPLGHTEIIDIPAVAPTATAPGYTHQSHCSVCGETVVKRELIGHGEYDIQINNDIVTAQKFDAATSESDGASVTITFELKNNVYLSYIDKTVIYKVGEVKLSKSEFTYNGKVQKPEVTVKDSKGENLVPNRDYILIYPANSKYGGRYTVTVEYIGNYAGRKTLYYNIVIGAVVPTASSSSTKSITLSWKKGHNDLSYCMYSVDSKGNLKKIADIKNGSYTVSSLKSGTEYRFLVRAYVKDEKGKIYWGDKGNSVLCATAPSKVSKLSVSSETKSVKLSWSAVSGATGYRVYMYDGSWKMVKDTKSISAEVTKLNSGKSYKFYVRPYKQSAGKTFWSTDNKSDAVSTFTKPSSTSKLSYIPDTTAVKLTWKKVSGATGYRIYIYDNLKDKYIKVADTSEASYTVKKKNGKKLKPGVEYKFRVKAYIKKNGKTYWSDSYKTVRTATKPAKTKLTVTSSKGKVTLSWKDVMGESGYQVYYATKKNGKYKKLTSAKANKVKFSKKLTKGKKYYFKVRAYKKVSGKTVYGSFSSVKSIKIK